MDPSQQHEEKKETSKIENAYFFAMVFFLEGLSLFASSGACGTSHRC
jgi:hypothetical protein